MPTAKPNTTLNSVALAFGYANKETSMDFNVEYANDLNRAEPLVRSKMLKVESETFAPWNAAHVAVVMERNKYRERVAELCAPWFDGSAFPND